MESRQGSRQGREGILTHPNVQEDIESIFKKVGNDLARLQGKRILITGGTGFIGTWLPETLSWLNENTTQPCKVYVPTRSPEAFARRVPHLATNPSIVFLRGEIADFQYPDMVGLNQERLFKQ